ncbi:SGNH/GDSL hydrolase family protein [Clostridium sp.]|uniref:SGNH/GDSL hydrolase family protein n=1 Tax=Clostridium sp. TaxID=1506 RepID=UPI002618CBD8|nr:SGNH/GDSL hydrolase family protein [Clostridium sp.]
MVRKVGIIMISVVGIIVAGGLYFNGIINVRGNTIDSGGSDIKSEGKELSVNKGREHLEELENLNVSDIEDKIKKSNLEASTKEILEKNGQIDYKKYYKNTVFFGDSLTEFLSAADILSQNSVVATKGRNVITAMQDVEKIKNLDPERIIMLFGMNDVEIFSNPSDFKSSYGKLIDAVKTALPKADIYIESPMPVQDKAAKADSKLTNDNVSRFREAAKELAKDEGVKYVDTTSLVTSDKYYEPDGIHYVYDFYPGLLKYLRTTIEINKIK